MDLPCFFYHTASDRGTPMTMETPKYKSIELRWTIHSTPPGWRCCEGQGFHQGFDMLHNHPQICGCCFFSWSVFAIFIQCSDEVSGEVVLSNEQKRNKTLLKSTFDGYDANIHTDQWDPTVLYIHDGSRTIMISSPMMWAFMAFPDLCKRLQACTLW